MKKEIADRWVKALRSGRYKQGKGKLRKDDEHCCLGVLCRILRTPSVQDRETNLYTFDGETSYLPDSAVLKAGMKNRRGSIWPVGISLADLNDRGESFHTIADIIEKHWEAL